MGNVFSKFVGFIAGERDEDEDIEYGYENEEEAPKKTYHDKMKDLDDNTESRKTAKLISLAGSRAASAISNNNKVIITQPHQYEETMEIVDYLKNKKSVIVNLEFVNKEDAKKIVDFLSGAAYGIDGNIQKISNYIFFIAPSNVEVHNESGKEDLRNRLSFSWLNKQ